MNLFNKVYNYHKTNFDKYSGKKFHFASRLYLWNQDDFYYHKLQELKPIFLEKNFLLKEYTNKKEVFLKFSAERLSHLNKFPQFLTNHDILLQGLYAQSVYGENHLAIIKNMVSADDLLNLEQSLFANEQSLAWLSTYSVTFLYLYHRWFLKDEDTLDLDKITEIGLTHLKESNIYELNLKIYYFTHCIIGETLFYAKKIPTKHQQKYLKMLKIVEELITNNYFYAHIDHKLEFLMCCRICNYRSKLEVKIFEEINQSLSVQGDFLVDTLNYYKEIKGGFDFYKAEHQNVLFLMSCQEYSPHALR